MIWGMFHTDTVRRFIRCTDGNATIEFVVLFGPLLYMIFTIAELGIFMTRTVMFDRGLDIAMRDVRLGIPTNPEAVKTAICENAFLLIDCENAIYLEVTPLDDFTAFGSTSVTCRDQTVAIQPADKFTPPGNEKKTFVQACLSVSPLFPGVGLGAMLPKLPDGNYGIIARTAFMNEPG
jgi:hypothetical protein